MVASLAFLFDDLVRPQQQRRLSLVGVKRFFPTLPKRLTRHRRQMVSLVIGDLAFPHHEVTTCHFPPETSKWNTIEHRLFSYVSRNWPGQPLASLALIINLIGATRTTTGLRVRCELDRGTYPKGRAISAAQLAALRLTSHRFHGDWNYTIHPIRHRP